MTMLLLPTRAVLVAAIGACLAVGAWAYMPAAAQTDAPTAAAAPTDSMPMYRSNAERTGYVNAAMVTPLSVAWQNTTKAVDGNTSSPVAADGMIFFGDAGHVYALRASDGSIAWTFPTNGSAGPFYGSPTVADGKVFIGGDNSRLYALDEKTGDSLWQIVTGQPVRSAPVVYDGVVYFGSMDSKLYAVKIADQQPVWGGQFRTTGPIITPATIAGDDVLFADANDTIYCTLRATGRLLWSASYENGLTDTPAVFSNGDIIVASDRDIYGISPNAGQTLWHVRLPSMVSAPVAISQDAGTVYAVTALGDLYAVDTRGKIAWSAPLGMTTKAAPVATKNAVVIAGTEGVVEALDNHDGHLMWSYSLRALPPPGDTKYTSNGVVTAAPLVTPNGDIYTLGNDGTVTAFKANAVDEIPPTATLDAPSTTKKVAGAQIPYEVKVTDAGSGIDPASVSLTVDGSPLPVEYTPKTNLVTVKTTSSGMLYGTAPVALPTLADGPHTLKLTARDWRGNELVQTWRFTVDNKLNPAGSSPAIAPPSNSASSSGSQTQSQADGSDAASPAAGAPNVGGGFPAGAGPAPSASGAGSGPGASGGATSSPTAGGGGTTRIPGGSNPTSGPVTPTPIAPPPGTSNFPPPPPI